MIKRYRYRLEKKKNDKLFVLSDKIFYTQCRHSVRPDNGNCIRVTELLEWSVNGFCFEKVKKNIYL